MIFLSFINSNIFLRTVPYTSLSLLGNRRKRHPSHCQKSELDIQALQLSLVEQGEMRGLQVTIAVPDNQPTLHPQLLLALLDKSSVLLRGHFAILGPRLQSDIKMLGGLAWGAGLDFATSYL